MKDTWRVLGYWSTWGIRAHKGDFSFRALKAVGRHFDTWDTWGTQSTLFRRLAEHGMRVKVYNMMKWPSESQTFLERYILLFVLTQHIFALIRYTIFRITHNMPVNPVTSLSTAELLFFLFGVVNVKFQQIQQTIMTANS